MYKLSQAKCIRSKLLQKRHVGSYHGTCNKKTNYYAVLGLTPKATQTQIKGAYYKLSMLYHPDKNMDSNLAAQKFRDITEAYEVLGNYTTRKRYDKGLLGSFGPHSSDTDSHGGDAFGETDSSERAYSEFYSNRDKKGRPAPPRGRTRNYNFDEFYQAHYGDTINRESQARAQYNEFMRNTASETGQSHNLIALGIMAFMLFFVDYYISASRDSPLANQPYKRVQNPDVNKASIDHLTD